MTPTTPERRSSLRLKASKKRLSDLAELKIAITTPKTTPNNKKPKLQPDDVISKEIPPHVSGEAETPSEKTKSEVRRAVENKTSDQKKGGDVASVISGGIATLPGVLETNVEVAGDLVAKVTETLRIFNKHLLQFVQEKEQRCKKMEMKIRRLQNRRKKSKDEEEQRCKKYEENKKASKSKLKKKKGGKTELSKMEKGLKSQDNISNNDSTKRVSKRPDLKALTKMTEAKEILYPQKRFGPIPGIEVGHQFFSRAEMVATGLHSHWLFGIDYICRSSAANASYDRLTLPLAISIVISGQYEDDLDNSDDVIYTGQGGNNLLGNRRQVMHQKMERGNLGLKNSMEQNVPVRVTRGHKCKNSHVGKVYTYDGLYKVVKYWAETGVSGFTVYKFQLKRLDNQPPLTTSQVYYIKGKIPNTVSEIRGLVCADLSGGLEDIPIPATNLVDDPPIAPTGLTYIRHLQISPSVQLPPNSAGCSCKGSCTNSRSCSCAKLNGMDFPYVRLNGGRLIEPKAVVFECGSNCGCGPDCVNRTSQKGLRYRLEVFRTAKKGWAVRSWDFIPAGAPVCEYIGILMKTQDINSSRDTNYVFDIDCLQTMQGLDGRERRLGDVSLPLHLQKGDIDAGPEFCIDAVSTGNVARFINHSCQPNLFVQCVLSNHQDLRQARVMLFAADNIPPLTELSYDYGYPLDSVVGPDGNIKQMICYCGAVACRKRLF